MTILLYDYRDLDEKTSNGLTKWKTFHAIIFFLAATFGILNFFALYETEQVVGDNCVLFPRKLEFKWVNVTEVNIFSNDTGEVMYSSRNIFDKDGPKLLVESTRILTEDKSTPDEEFRIVPLNTSRLFNETRVKYVDGAKVVENSTTRLILDWSRSLLSECPFQQYMPLTAAVFAAFWTVMFIICPGGGKSRGTFQVQQPWRIVVPALGFSLVVMTLTGVSYATTSNGLDAFCAAFQNVTNTTNCTTANYYEVLSWDSAWGVSERVSVTRAAAGASWGCWLGACALILLRCFTAPDFTVKTTKVILKDPAGHITQHLKKARRDSNPSAPSSPSEITAALAKSEPTASELVTVSVENEFDSEPSSLLSTPVKLDVKGEVIEMTSHSHDIKKLNDDRAEAGPSSAIP